MLDCFYKLEPRNVYLIQENYYLLQAPKVIKPTPQLRTNRAREKKKMAENPYDKTEKDFICIVYYLDSYKVKVKIYRIDQPIGWTQNLKLQIGENEILDIGSSLDNLLEKEFLTKNPVHPNIPIETKIPKIIIQTGYFSKQVDKTIQSFLDFNPDFLYLFYDNLDCILFFKKYFPNDLEYYLRLRPGAFRADFFRYAFLYKFGGCYFDHKLICRAPIDLFIKNENCVLCADWDYNLSLDTFKDLYNAVIMIESGHPLLEKVLEMCRKNIKEQVYLDGAFSVTGPALFKKCFDYISASSVSHIKFKHLAFIPWTNHKNMIVVHRESNKIFLNKSYFVPNPKSGEYHELYAKRKIYYPWVLILEHLIMYSDQILELNQLQLFNPHHENALLEIVDLEKKVIKQEIILGQTNFYVLEL